MKRDTSKSLKNVDSKFTLKKLAVKKTAASENSSSVLLNELQSATHPNASAELGVYQEKKHSPN